jgi:diadenosine tetraphosphate (Ap4A) HIT family hydrolase
MATSDRPDCSFCEIIHGRRDLFSTNPYVPRGLQIPMQTPNFVAFPDAAPLSEGHTLVVPREHSLSIAAMRRSVQEELLGIAEQVCSPRVSPGMIQYFFEHGSRTEDEMAGCSTTHAHFHLLEGRAGLIESLKRDSSYRSFGSLTEAWATLAPDDYYLLGAKEEGILGTPIYEHPSLRCRLFMRTLFAAHSGRPELSNYRRYEVGPRDHLSATIRRAMRELRRTSQRIATPLGHSHAQFQVKSQS